MINPALDEIAAPVILRPSSGPCDACSWCNGMEYHHTNTKLWLHREMLDFVRWLGPTPDEKHIRLFVVRRFCNAINALRPDATVVCHGSTATGAYLRTSDIDLVVLRDLSLGHSLLSTLHSHFESLKVFRMCEFIGQARIPIIKGIEKSFGFHIDISINTEAGFLNVPRTRDLFRAVSAAGVRETVPISTPTRRAISRRHWGHHPAEHDHLHHPGFLPGHQMHFGRLLLTFFKGFGQMLNYIIIWISTRGDGRLFSKFDIHKVNRADSFYLCIGDRGSFLAKTHFGQSPSGGAVMKLAGNA
jgi:DNA polymerase sigma